MPRRARVILPGTPLHLIQRGNNRCACFFDDQDYQFYLEWLGEYAKQTGCSVHAYVLMTNHVHLLVSGRTNRSVGDLMKRLGQRYVQYVNRTYRRSGTLWEGGSLLPDTRGILCTGLLPIHRTQPGSGRYRCPPWRVPMVKLRRERATGGFTISCAA
ncbi:transposase [Abyssibacter profundi]|uniref:transposase n=1 Tax=Abyssibacter profundi TaxID=2182787 RepID=UPI001FAE7E89|nr:transposase [Abyssibacter profundi]